MKRLDDAHAWAPGPEQLACCSGAESDCDVAQLDRTAPGIRVDYDLCWNSIRQTEIVGSGHPIDEHPSLVASPNRINYGAGIRRIGFLGEFVESWLIIKAAINPP
ncbi:hypothetical protein GOL30_28015 [Sinorhizobium medicae]|nr:hypothetical protein [Sinorhizobium medicae]MDX0531522.1 hypothetical protein [Sinorhizobium medicae]MDX1078492.1 hypothetical protein [Sinorhizobium medicae]